MDPGRVFEVVGISLGLGLLVGMQRERVEAPLAGVRTFALITLFGTLTAMLAQFMGPWVLAAGLIGIASATAVGNLVFLKHERPDAGITTEIAILVMYGLGAFLVYGDRTLAVVLGAIIALLLHAKPVLHGFVKRLGETEMRVIMQFVLITMVILPVLPNRPYGPFDVLNPREIWWMVVLVVVMNLAGYVALKLWGGKAGIVMAGLIGGLISSTATAVSSARRAGEHGQAAAATLLILLATTVVYARVLAEVTAVAPGSLKVVAPPIAIMMLASAIICWIAWRSARRAGVEPLAHKNPTELRPALVFGALYALVLWVVAAARHSLGDRGVYLAAGISGLTDMDAITLSTSRMGARGALESEVVWRAIMIAIMANLVFKSVIVMFLGGVHLGKRVAAGFGAQLAVGLALLLAWPR